MPDLVESFSKIDEASINFAIVIMDVLVNQSAKCENMVCCTIVGQEADL